MKMIDLGGSGLSVSAVALGCMRIRELDVAKLERLVGAALDAGINFFDHADIYGGEESCEARFGELLRRSPGLRDRMLIQSKCGIRKGFFDFSREHILASVDRSLSRLGTDRLDVLLLHRPDTLMEPEEVAGAFEELHRTGKVRFFGVSNQNPGQMALLQRALPFKLLVDQLQFGPAHTLLIDSGLNVNLANDGGVVRDGDVLGYCRLNGITIQAWSPFQYGFFEEVFLNSPRYAQLNETLGRIGLRYNLSPAAAVIAWISRHPAGIQTIVGSTRPDRISDLARGAGVPMTREEWYEIYRAAGNRLP